MYRRLRSSLSLLFVGATMAGLGQELVLRQFDEENGLPSNCVLDLFVDSENLLWVGTNKGLYRYDGFDFERIGVGTALDSVNIVSMYEDTARHQMLLSSYGERLFAYRNNAVREFAHDRPDVGKTLGGSIGEHLLLRDGSFRATHSQHPSTYVIDPDRFTIRTTKNTDARFAGRVEEVNDRLLTTCYHHHPHLPLKDAIHWGGADTTIRVTVGPFSHALCTPHAGKLRGGGNYMHHYTTLVLMTSEGAWHRVDLENNILGVHVDERNHLWVRVEGVGLRCFDARLRPLPISAPALERTNISDCVRDKQGGFWFSTVDRGLFYCASPDVLTYSAQRAYHTAWASSLAALDTATVLVGTANAQLYRSTVGSGTSLEASADELGLSGEVKSIEVDEDIVIPGSFRMQWSISRSKPIRFPRRDERWGAVHDVQPIDSTRTLLAGIGGLRLADTRTPDTLYLLYTQARCYRIVPGPMLGTWCAACLDGLHLYGPDGIRRYAETDPLLRTPIRDMVRARDTLWLATHKGVMVHTTAGTSRLALPGNVPFPECRAFAEGPGGSLWVASLDGLFHIQPAPGGPVIARYGRAQGLPSDAHYDVVRTGRWIWSISGADVCFFDPDDTRMPTPYTTMNIMEVSGWAGDRKVGTGTSFDHSVDHVRMVLRGVNYARFERDAFRYRLDRNGPWAYARGTVVDLLGLRPGSYVAEVQAADAVGGWSPSLTVPWTIHPAWWQRSAVRMSAVALIMTLIGAGAWYYRERRQRERWLASEVQRYHHKALIAQMEPHFLFNALTSIQGFVARGDVDASTRYMAKFAKLMRGLLQAARDEVVRLSDEVATLENYCALEALRSNPTFTYTIEVDPSIDASTVVLPSFLVQPYVENAVRHGLRNLGTERPGRLSVRFAPAADGGLVCTVEDNGVGRQATASLQRTGDGWRSMGTSINTERFRLMERMHGPRSIGTTTEDLNDDQGKVIGTRVTLRLPVIGEREQPGTTTERDDESSGGGR